eukprot:gene3547-biopygen4354
MLNHIPWCVQTECYHDDSDDLATRLDVPDGRGGGGFTLSGARRAGSTTLPGFTTLRRSSTTSASPSGPRPKPLGCFLSSTKATYFGCTRKEHPRMSLQ